MAEYERNLIRERTMAGLASARAHGRMGGRPKKLEEGQVRVAILRRSSWHRSNQSDTLASS